MPKGIYKPLTKADEEKLRTEYLDKPIKVLAEEIGIGFGRVKRFLSRNNLEIPRELVEQRKRKGRFKKGQTSPTKGLKQSDFMSKEALERTKKTRFKKGHVPHNTKADGAIVARKDKSGRTYKYIRIRSGVWELYHRYLWEKHNGPIPEGHVVIFIDGDSERVSMENLKLISQAENMYRNSNQDYPEEIIPSLVLMNELEKKLKELENAS